MQLKLRKCICCLFLFCICMSCFIFISCEDNTPIEESIVKTITYYDGSELLASNAYEDLTENTAILTPVKKGYVFSYWYVNGLENEPIAIEQIQEYFSTNDNLELYAKWELQNYSITYLNTIGINSNKTSYSIEDDEILLTCLADTEDQEFDGWYIDGQRVESISAEEAKDLQIEARWTEKPQVVVKYMYDDLVLEETSVYVKKGTPFDVDNKSILGYNENGVTVNGVGVDLCERIESVSQNYEIVINYEIDALEMPIVIIKTDKCEVITSKENYLTSSVSIINTKQEWVISSASAGVRGRGNYTWTLPKKGYRIKFDSKTSLFGSSYKQKSWALLANYTDKSLARNYIAQEFAECFEDISFASMHQFVELYLNGEYMGVYLLCDQIQTGEGRVDIDESYENEVDPGDIGYLLEMDEYAPNEGTENKDYVVVDGKNYAIKTPDTDSKKYNAEVSTEFIKAYLSDCIKAIKGDDYAAVEALIDVNSFAETYIISEVIMNPDIDWSSFYLYKDKGGKLTSGPVWDYDLAAGNCGFSRKENFISPIDTMYSSIYSVWYSNLLRFDEFKSLVLTKLNYYKDSMIEIINNLKVDNNNGLFAQYKDSLNRNFSRWQIFDMTVYPNPYGLTTLKSVEAHIDYLYNWLLARLYYVIDYYS